MSSNTVKFDDEVKKLYELFLEKEKALASPLVSTVGLSHPESKRIGYRYILIPFLSAMVLAVIGWFIYQSEWLKLGALLLMLVGYVGIIAVQLLEMYKEKESNLQFLKNPLVVYISSLVEDASIELQIVDELKNYSLESLELVKSGFETGHMFASRRISMLVGAMEKVGVLPGLITLYLADSNSANQFAVPVALVAFFIYFVAFVVFHALPRFNYYKSLIDFEILRRKGAYLQQTETGS